MEKHKCFDYPLCEQHPDPFDCADHSVVMTPVGWAIPIRDGGSSFRLINYCPFCSERLATPEEEVGKICIDIPDEE